MSEILEMIKNEKVEWKKIEDIFDIRTGYTPSKSKKDYWENGDVNWFTIEDIRQRGNILDYANVKINQKAVKKSSFDSNSIVLSTIGTIGEHALILTDFVINQQFIVLTLKKDFKNKINMYYINYYFYKIDEFCIRHKRVGNIPTVDNHLILKQKIAIPSVETQEQIVEILDNFVKYSTELQAELQNRSSQYEYFRDLVLSKNYLIKLTLNRDINQNCQKLKTFKIGDLFNTRNGYTPSKSKKEFWDKKEIPWFKMEDIRENGNILRSAKTFASKLAIKGKAFEKNSIILATSATIGEHALITVPFLANQRFTCFTLKDDFKNEINIKFMYYYFYIIDRWCINNVKIGNFPSVEVDRLLNQKISIPNIEIQNKVVEVLDKFQNLISDAEGLLPEEIEQRQKQYEYYREKLLTFENNRVQGKASSTL